MNKITSLLLAFVAVVCFPSLSSSQQRTGKEVARGIERKDIRVAIAYTADSDAALARALAQELEPVVAAIASGAQLTKADAAPHRFQNWLLTMLSQRPKNRVLVMSCTRTSAARSGEGSLGAPCPASCGVLGEWCLCPLDHVPVKSTFTDVEPIVIVVNSRAIEPAQVEQLAAELKVTLPSGTPIVREIKRP